MDPTRRVQRLQGKRIVADFKDCSSEADRVRNVIEIGGQSNHLDSFDLSWQLPISIMVFLTHRLPLQNCTIKRRPVEDDEKSTTD